MNRLKHHVKKGDQVEVISGNFRGSTGKVLQVLSRKERVLIEGVRMIKKHLRKSQDNPSGSIAERERKSGRAEREGREKEGQDQSDEGEKDEERRVTKSPTCRLKPAKFRPG